MPRNQPPNKVFPGSVIAFLIVAGLFAAWGPGTAGAGEAYVSNLTITVRRGPGIDYKIISFLHPGNGVEVIGRESGWRQVRFGENRTGWVLERYLTEEASLLSRKEAILAEHERLTGAVAVLERSNSSLRAYSDEKTRVPRAAQENVSHSPQELTRALNLARRLLKEETLRVRRLQEERKVEENLGKWFLIGSGMAGIGMVLGVLTYRSRRWFKFKS